MDERESEFLRGFLAEREVACPMCGYSLRGLTAEKCPECGSELELMVGLTEPRMAVFMAGLVALAAGLGFKVLLLCWAMWMFAAERGGPRLRELWVVFLGVVVLSGALTWWLRSRKRFRLMKPEKRKRLVLGCYILVIFLAVLFFSTVR